MENTSWSYELLMHLRMAIVSQTRVATNKSCVLVVGSRYLESPYEASTLVLECATAAVKLHLAQNYPN